MGEREKPVKVIREKRNWSAPGPDRMTHFWWKRARSLQEGVVKTGGTGMRSVEREYKSVKVKAAVNLYKNPDLTMEGHLFFLRHISRNPKRNSLRKWFEIRSGKESY